MPKHVDTVSFKPSLGRLRAAGATIDENRMAKSCVCDVLPSLRREEVWDHWPPRHRPRYSPLVFLGRG